MWSAQGCKVGTNREQGRGGKWGGDSSELTGTQTSIIRERARGGKWRGDSSELTGTQTSIIREQPGTGSGDEQGAPRGGKWGRPEAQRSLLGTALTPGHSAYAPGHSTRPHVGHTPITMRTAGHDHGYKSDITPAQHAKTRLRPEVTSTIHDTVFDLWTTQAQGRTQQSQGRTYNAPSQNPGFQIRAKLSDGPALANDAPDPQGNSPKNSAGASPSSSEKEPPCLSAKRSRTTHRRPSK